MNWGKWIVAAFIAFAVFIFSLVTIAMRQDVPLVTKEYYYEEIHFQDQIDRKQRAAELAIQPDISINGEGRLLVTYPEFNKLTSGQVTLFRPSDDSLDQTFDLIATNDDSQTYRLKSVKKGLYRAQMRWTMDGKEYYIEKVIVL